MVRVLLKWASEQQQPNPQRHSGGSEGAQQEPATSAGGLPHILRTSSTASSIESLPSIGRGGGGGSGSAHGLVIDGTAAEEAVLADAPRNSGLAMSGGAVTAAGALTGASIVEGIPSPAEALSPTSAAVQQRKPAVPIIESPSGGGFSGCGAAVSIFGQQPTLTSPRRGGIGGPAAAAAVPPLPLASLGLRHSPTSTSIDLAR